MIFDDSEFIDNSEPRCPVVLLLDNSYSMSGDPIQELNKGIEVFKQDIQEDSLASLRVETAIITFGGKVDMIQDFTTIDKFNPPQLSASGNTPMGKAIELALDRVEDRKQIYKDNGIAPYQPWIVLITDGQPTDKWENAAKRVRQAARDRKLSFYAIAVKGANMEILRQIAPSNTPPLILDGLKFQELFKWLSASVKSNSSEDPQIGKQVEIPIPPELNRWTETVA